MAPESYDDLIGFPWVLDGRTTKGLDCFGLAVIVLERMGYEMDTAIADKWIRSYKPGEVDPEEVTSIECDISEVPRKPGDLVIMRHPQADDGRATHIGVHIGKNLIIHSTRGCGVHIVPYQQVVPYTVEVITWID